MPHAPISLKRLCFETFGLTLAMAAVTLVVALHHFQDLGFETGRAALAFSLGVLFLGALPVQLFMALRLFRMRKASQTLFEAATRDGLTRLLNRTTFRGSAEMAMVNLGRRRRDDHVFTLLIADADHFKSINDRFGHAAGDRALRLIAATLEESVRADDIVGRLGGEEFGILLRNAGAAEARIVADRLREAVSQHVVGSTDAPMRLAISLGGITFANALPFDVLYRAADANLYRAKRAGRNRLELTNLVRPVRAEGDNRGATAILAHGMERPAGDERRAANGD